ETDRLARLADDLLVLARSDRGELQLKPERVRVRDLLERVARSFRATAGQIEVEAVDGIEVRADALRLEQALGNLVANAATHGEPPVRLSADRDGDSVMLRVSDAGPG